MWICCAGLGLGLNTGWIFAMLIEMHIWNTTKIKTLYLSLISGVCLVTAPKLASEI
jgi:hypothetical protein